MSGSRGVSVSVRGGVGRCGGFSSDRVCGGWKSGASVRGGRVSCACAGESERDVRGSLGGGSGHASVRVSM